MNETAPRVTRVNTLKTTRETCLAALVEEGVQAHETTCAAHGIVLEGRRSLYRTEAFAQGWLESQDEASQLVAELVAPPPKSFTIDACAGAGGKTLGLAALLAGKGKLLALDASASKIEELRRRARRAGASNVEGRVVDLRGARATRAQRATRVLVDAPCTGLGAIAATPRHAGGSSPTTFRAWSRRRRRCARWPRAWWRRTDDWSTRRARSCRARGRWR